MTATTFDNGLRARLFRLARGSVVLAIVLGICGLGGASATAATDAESEDPTPVELLLSAGVRGTVAPGSATTASLTVLNDATSTLSAGRVVVELNRTPLADETAVTSWLDDAEAQGGFEDLGTDTSAPVDPQSSATSSLFIPAETLGDLAPGVYPLRATLSGAETDDQDDEDPGSVRSTSVLIVTPASSPPIAVMVPITATPADGALLTAEELTALTAADGALTAALEGVGGTSAILAVDPSIAAAIRVLGTSAPEAAQEWLRQLDALPNERFALQVADADATTQAQAGLTALLQPTTLAPFLDPNDFSAVVEETPSPTPTPIESETPPPAPVDGPVLPDDAELTAVDGAVPGILWPRSDVSADDLAAFAGFLSDSGATTVLSSSAVSGAIGARATVDGHNVLVADDAASDALSRAASENDTAVRQRWLAEASAHLYLSGQASPTTPRLVAVDRDETRGSDALNETIGAVDSLGFGLSGVLAAPASAAALTTEQDPSRATSLQRMLDSEVVLGEFATILDERQVLLSPKRLQIMRATAVGLSADGFSAAVTAVHAATSETLQAVDIPPASTIQLLSANADLPFSVRNDLPWPVNVQLAVFPSDARLDVQSVTPATIQPGTTMRVRVPVSARVGSGEVTLRLELSSPTGVQIGQPEIVRVSVRAEWETIGLALLGGLIVLLLGLGIIRTVRRKRREAAETTAENTVAETTVAETTVAETTVAENTVAENTVAENKTDADADADAAPVEESNE